MITPGGELDRPVFRPDDGIQAFHVDPWVGICQCEGTGAVLVRWRVYHQRARLV
jgi:hypothetical protein